MKMDASTQNLTKIEELKKIIKKIETIKNFKNDMYKHAYELKIITKKKENKIQLIISNGHDVKIFKIEMKYDQYKNAIPNITGKIKGLHNEIINTIKKILEKSKRNKIIKKYNIDSFPNDTSINKWHIINYIDSYVYLYIDKELIKEIENDKVLKEYLDHDIDNPNKKYLIIPLHELVEYETIYPYYIDYNENWHYSDSVEIYYISKNEAKRLIKELSKNEPIIKS